MTNAASCLRAFASAILPSSACNIYPLVGDAIAITVVERDPGESSIEATVKMDGSRGNALSIPAGGMRLPSSAQTAVLEDAGDNNLRAKDHLFMDGSAIFNFVQ